MNIRRSTRILSLLGKITVEEKALIWARKQKGNVLNNKNVDSFIAGYNTAAKEYKKIISDGQKEIFTGLAEKLEEQIEKDKHGLELSGYTYSYPAWLIRKKNAYIALRDALNLCKEFMEDIQRLL